MTPTMYPYLSYRDAATALRFLEGAFGFTTTVRWEAGTPLTGRFSKPKRSLATVL